MRTTDTATPTGGAVRTERLPSRPARRWQIAAVLAGLAGPAVAEVGNAVVIDFGQGRLVLGWLGLWLVAALTFTLCADKRIQLMTRLADYLRRRAQQRADDRSDAALRVLAQHDPRILGDLRMAIDRAAICAEQAAQPIPVTVAATPALRATPQPASAARASRSRGFRAAPMPGMPRHLQYLPG